MSNKILNQQINKNLIEQKYQNRKTIKITIHSFKIDKKGRPSKVRDNRYTFNKNEFSKLVIDVESAAKKSTEPKYRAVVLDTTTGETLAFVSVDNIHDDIFEKIESP